MVTQTIAGKGKGKSKAQNNNLISLNCWLAQEADFVVLRFFWHLLSQNDMRSRKKDIPQIRSCSECKVIPGQGCGCCAQVDKRTSQWFSSSPFMITAPPSRKEMDRSTPPNRHRLLILSGVSSSICSSLSASAGLTWPLGKETQTLTLFGLIQLHKDVWVTLPGRIFRPRGGSTESWGNPMDSLWCHHCCCRPVVFGTAPLPTALPTGRTPPHCIISWGPLPSHRTANARTTRCEPRGLDADQRPCWEAVSFDDTGASQYFGKEVGTGTLQFLSFDKKGFLWTIGAKYKDLLQVAAFPCGKKSAAAHWAANVYWFGEFFYTDNH